MAFFQDLQARAQAAQASFSGASWWRDYLAAYGGGAQSLADWMNTRAPNYSDWDQRAAEFASGGLAGLQDIESGPNAPFGINELKGAGETVANVAAKVVPPVLVVTAGIAGGEALLYATGATAGAGATLEAGAAGETASAIAGEGGGVELFSAGEAVNTSVGPGVELFSASEAGMATTPGIVDRFISYGESQLERLGMSKISQMINGGGTAPRSSGTPALAKQNYLPLGNLGAIYGARAPLVEGSFGGFGRGISGESSGSSASSFYLSKPVLALALLLLSIPVVILLRK